MLEINQVKIESISDIESESANLEDFEEEDLEKGTIRGIQPKIFALNDIQIVQPQQKIIRQRKIKQDTFDIEMPKLKSKIRNSSFERKPNSFAFFSTGMLPRDSALDGYRGSAIAYFRETMHALNENEMVFRQRQLLPVEKHKGNKGHKHNYITYRDRENDQTQCIICGDPYGKHQESLSAFKSGSPNKVHKMKSVHSFYEFEKFELNKLNEESHSLDKRIREANKNLFRNGQTTFNCDICYMEVEMINITFLECGHYFCKQCLTDYYNYMVNVGGQVHKIKCPNIACLKQIDSSQIKELLDSNSYEKFQKFMKNYEVQTGSNKKFCPFPGCEEVISGKKGQKETTCPQCKRKFCYSCQIPWHSGKSCKKALDEQYKGWAYKINAHKCPKCQVPIEKNQGCSHMSCQACGHYFCWLCGMPVHHWTHTNDKFNPFSCKYVHQCAGNWVALFLLFLLGFICIPLMLFFFPIIYAMYYCIVIIGECWYKTCKIRKFIWCFLSCLCMGPITIFTFAIGLALSAALGALVAAILTPIAYGLHIFFFFRTIYWWNKNRIKD